MGHKLKGCKFTDSRITVQQIQLGSVCGKQGASFSSAIAQDYADTRRGRESQINCHCTGRGTERMMQTTVSTFRTSAPSSAHPGCPLTHSAFVKQRKCSYAFYRHGNQAGRSTKAWVHLTTPGRAVRRAEILHRKFMLHCAGDIPGPLPPTK